MKLENKPIPERIVLYAKHITDSNYCQQEWDQQELNKDRENAMEAIRRYRERKKRIAEQNADLENIREWLKSLDNEA